MSPKVTHQEPATTGLVLGLLHRGRILSWACPFHRWESRWGEPFSLSLLFLAGSVANRLLTTSVSCILLCSWVLRSAGHRLPVNPPHSSYSPLPSHFHREKLRIKSRCFRRGRAEFRSHGVVEAGASMPQVPSSQIQLWSVRSWRGISTYQRYYVWNGLQSVQLEFSFWPEVDSSTWDEREEKKQMKQWF